MGANSSRESTGSTTSGASSPQKYSDLVDLGSLLPCGIYPNSPQDYDYRSIRKLIIDRRIAPFYKGLNDVPELEEDPPAPNGIVESLSVPVAMPQASSSTSTASAKKNPTMGRPRSASSSSVNSAGRPTSQSLAVDSAKERQRALIERMKAREKVLYNDAVECPICFLIRRPPEAPATPASCPFCVEENFGILYKPPQWSQVFERQQLSRDGEPMKAVPLRNGATHTTSGKGTNSSKPRRQSVSHKDPEVILVDHIRPDWNRMIDVTRAAPGSRRNSATQANSSRSRAVGGAIGSIMTRPGRSASSAASNEYYVSAAMRRMNLQNMDLEDLMVMEAVRLSLLEEEERRRNEQRQQHQTATENGNSSQGVQNSQSAGTESEVTLEEVNEEEEEEEDDDDDQPLFNSVVNGIRERQNTTENNTEVTCSTPVEGKSNVNPGVEPDESHPSTIATGTSAALAESEVVDLSAFPSSSNDHHSESRDRKPLIVVESDDRSHLDGVSSI
ncbi:SNF1-interacting protein [Umbelopsis nana]